MALCLCDMPEMKKYLLVLTGPTASGKTALSVQLAKRYQTDIISADSRQIYKEMIVGTASPSAIEMDGVKHHFVREISIQKPFDVATFESEALARINQLFNHHDIVILTGGSGLFIDAVCFGLDNIPETQAGIREAVNQLYVQKGLSGLQEKLKALDPVYYEKVDLQNPRRLQRALEVCLQTGKPYSYFRKRMTTPRPFEVIWIALEVDRLELINRINLRVEDMMTRGLLEEARGLYPFRKLNALNTVGYQELFRYFDRLISLEEAVEEIKVNTRQYAKRQMTWFRKNKQYKWFTNSQLSEMIHFIDQEIGQGNEVGLSNPE